MKAVKRLWAPWRLAYIKDKKPKGCPFCVLVKEEPSVKNLVLFTNKDFFVVLNKFPYNPYHMMIIPNIHEGEPQKLSPKLWSTLAIAQQLCLQLLDKALTPQGYNMGMNLGTHGGAGLPEHLHWHIVPRWQGDTNFMPLIAETKALPVHNEQIYNDLLPHFKNFGANLKKATQK